MEKYEVVKIKYEYEYRCIKYMVKKNNEDYKDKYIFLSDLENELFHELHLYRILKIKNFEDKMEDTALRTAICRLRKKINKLYEIHTIRQVGYALVRRYDD